MRVQFVQSGGFAGTIRHCTLDTATMGADEAAALEALVRKADLNKPAPIARAGSARDLEEYQVSIEDDDGKTTIVRDQSTLSPEAKALVAYLKKCAKPGMPKE
jgi:hypothetical protein